MSQLWDDCQALVRSKNHILHPLQENMTEYFEWLLEEEGNQRLGHNQYERRPTFGLKLDMDDDHVLAIRPGWQAARKRRERDQDGQVVRKLIAPGVIIPSVIELALLNPGKQLTVILRERILDEDPGIWVRGKIWLDMSVNEANLIAMLRGCHHLLNDPWETFSGQADRCCCCRKRLTDIVSRTPALNALNDLPGLRARLMRLWNIEKHIDRVMNRGFLHKTFGFEPLLCFTTFRRCYDEREYSAKMARPSSPGY